MAVAHGQSDLLVEKYDRRSDFSDSGVDEAPDEKEYLPGPRLNRLHKRRTLLDCLYASPTLLKITLLSFLHTFIPSFLRPTGPAVKTKLHPTAYLDGVRGVAAFFVFIHHFILDWFPSLSKGYASGPESTYIFQLPIVRIIYSGRGMVTTFFIISGYVLSYKALRLMRSGQYSTLLDSLASSVFRRGLRLFLPTTFSTFICLLLARRDWYRQDPLGHNLVPGRMGDSFFGQLKDWWAHTIRISNPFQNVDIRSIFVHPYDGHLWTIPVEFRGSLVVFLTLLCVAKVPNITRTVLLLSVAGYTLWMLHWDLFLFLSGTLIADIGFGFAARSSDPINHHPELLDYIYILIDIIPRMPQLTSAKRSLLLSMATVLSFILALFLLCFPDEAADKSPGYIAIGQYAPKIYVETGTADKFWLSVGSFLLVGSIACSPALQRPFTTGFAQYLARISFALYLVHGPVLYTLGMKILWGALAAPTGWVGATEDEKWQPPMRPYIIAFMEAAVLNTAVCFWAADWLWRVVDTKAVDFARWISDVLWIKE